MRFVKQTTLSNCAPTAVLNVFKWCEIKVTSSDLKKAIKKEASTHPTLNKMFQDYKKHKWESGDAPKLDSYLEI